MRFFIFFSILASACVERGVGLSTQQTLIVDGTYEYADGDRLRWNCAHKVCSDVLVRDERLRRDALSLQGARLRLEVQRVDACGSLSSEVACVRSHSRTALAIVRWIRVTPFPRRP